MPSEIIVEFPSPLTDKEKKMIYGYKGELVRCKDCKYSDITDYGAGKALECILDRLYRINSISLEGETYFREVEPDDFCAWGERREND